jgi:hypothetical protein
LAFTLIAKLRPAGRRRLVELSSDGLTETAAPPPSVAAARDLRRAARHTAYAAGQAGVVAHLAAHERGAAAGAIKAARADAPASGEAEAQPRARVTLVRRP